VKCAQEVTLFSRHKKALNRRFPNVVDDLASLEGDLVLDEELVALDPARGAFISDSSRKSVTVASDFFSRIRFTKSKWRTFGEFAIFPASQVGGKPACRP
jgi:hypothetical protein